MQRLRCICQFILRGLYSAVDLLALPRGLILLFSCKSLSKLCDLLPYTEKCVQEGAEALPLHHQSAGACQPLRGLCAVGSVASRQAACAHLPGARYNCHHHSLAFLTAGSDPIDWLCLIRTIVDSCIVVCAEFMRSDALSAALDALSKTVVLMHDDVRVLLMTYSGERQRTKE